MDFQRDRLGPLLENSGFDARKRTFWLWEGVTMYLRPEVVSNHLSLLGALSAPGSRIAFTYLRRTRNGRIPRSLFLALLGEPVRSAFEPTEITGLAQSRSWRLISDTTIQDWLEEIPELKLNRRRIGLQWLESIWVGEA
jgi:methyltransferase (TIGR00027 family)